MRKSLIVLFAPVLLLGCERSNHMVSYQPRSVTLGLAKPEAPAPDIAISENQSFSYLHAIALEMPHANLEPRYVRSRDRCLHEGALNCKLVSSSLDKQESTTGYSAQLVVALPHEKVSAYERAVLAPLPGEKPGDVMVASSSTTAENVTQSATTARRKVAQLSDYRDRLLALLKRSNLSVDDLIKVEVELSKTQSDLDDALSEKSDVDDLVAREQITITLNERSPVASPFRPIADVWRNSITTLAESAAAMLEFVIAYTPWLPLIIGAIFLLRWFLRIARRGPSDARSRPG